MFITKSLLLPKKFIITKKVYYYQKSLLLQEVYYKKQGRKKKPKRNLQKARKKPRAKFDYEMDLTFRHLIKTSWHRTNLYLEIS